jgi:hypothetical protein
MDELLLNDQEDFPCDKLYDYEKRTEANSNSGSNRLADLKNDAATNRSFVDPSFGSWLLQIRNAL